MMVLRRSLSTKARKGMERTVEILEIASLCEALSKGDGRDVGKSLSGMPLKDLNENVVFGVIRHETVDVEKAFNFFKWAKQSSSRNIHSSKVYNTMIIRLCKSAKADMLPEILQDLRKDGCRIFPYTSKLLLHSLIKAGMFDMALEVLDDVETSVEGQVSLELYDSILLAFVRKNQAKLGFSIFESMMKSKICPSTYSFNKLLVSLRRAKMKVEFRKAFSQYRDKGYDFDTLSYNICIHAFGLMCQNVDFAEELFKEMKEKGIKPNCFTYTSLIAVRCKAGKLDAALGILYLMSVEHHRPDVVTYQILIHGLCQVNKVRNAFNLFDEMLNNGIKPDLRVYNSLFDGLFKVGRVEDACFFFEKIVEDGFIPDPYTYNILINGLLNNGREEAACVLFCVLKTKNDCVDVITYSTVISYLCKTHHGIEEALKLIEEMESSGLPLNTVAITTLLLAFHRSGKRDWANALVNGIKGSSLVWTAEMEELLEYRPKESEDHKFDLSKIQMAKEVDEDCRGSPLNDSVDTTLSANHSEEDLLEKSFDSENFPTFLVFKGKRVVDKGVELGLFNTYISLFSKKGLLDVSCQLFQKMTENGISPGTYTYNAMLSGLVKKGESGYAWELFIEMGRKLRSADIATYNVVIDALGKMGETEMAYSILHAMLRKGGYLDVTLYNTLINLAGKAGNLDEAVDLFERMQRSGLTPTVSTFNTLIDVHGRAGKVKDAHEFLRKMIHAGCCPNIITEKILDRIENLTSK